MHTAAAAAHPRLRACTHAAPARTQGILGADIEGAAVRLEGGVFDGQRLSPRQLAALISQHYAAGAKRNGDRGHG